MPLKKSSSASALSENIRQEVKSGRPVKQTAAIAYSVQKEAKKKVAKNKNK